MEIGIASAQDLPGVYLLFNSQKFFLDEEPPTQSDFISRVDWLYRKPPGDKFVEVIAKSEGKCLGHYGIVPLVFKKKNKLVSVGMASNVVIDAQARNHGLFLKLQLADLLRLSQQ